MRTPRSSRLVLCTARLLLVAVTAAMFGCRNEQSAAPAPAAAQSAHNKQRAMAALMALPELKAWSSQIGKASGGQAHGALIEYDARPKVVGGKRYFQLSFVENSSAAAHRWESFLVAETGDEILVEDNAANTTMTLAQWRAAKHPMRRTGVDESANRLMD